MAMTFTFFVSNDPNLMIVQYPNTSNFYLYFDDDDLLSGTLEYCKRQATKWKTTTNRLRWKIDNEGYKRLNKRWQ